MPVHPFYALVFLAGVTLVIVMYMQCGGGDQPPRSLPTKEYSESYEANLSIHDREFVSQIIDPPREFNTAKLQTYSTSLQTRGNWGRGCECNFAKPSDGRGFQLTGYY